MKYLTFCQNEQKNKHQRGALMVMFALILMSLLFIMGLAIDFGSLYVQRNKLQDIADAAALAGASQITKETRAQKPYDDSLEIPEGAVAKAVADYVYLNNSSFADDAEGINLAKAGYVLYDALGISSSENVNANFVKLQKFEDWVDENKPKLAEGQNWKIEYAISGSLNAKNFPQYPVDEEYATKYNLEEDKRVRVRLTKRVPLILLHSLFLGSQYENGVPLTVMAAAKPAIAGTSGSGDSSVNANVKVPIILSNGMNFSHVTPSQFNYSMGGSNNTTVDTGFYALYGNDTNYGLNDTYASYQSSGYFCIKPMQTQDVASYLNAGNKWRVFRIGESGYGSGAHIVAQQQSNGQWRVGFTNSYSFSKDAKYYEASMSAGNNISYTEIDKASAMTSVIDLWLTDIIRMKECYSSMAANGSQYSNYNDYTVKLYTGNQDSDAGLNRLYSYFYDNNYNKKKDEGEDFAFDPDNFSLYVNTGGNPTEFGKYVVGNNKELQQFVLTNYHLVYNKNWYQKGRYSSQWTSKDTSPLDYSDIDQESSNLAQIKNIKFLGTNGSLVIATEGVTYGDIYSSNDIYILGKNNKFTGNIYCANNLHLGGENNTLFAYTSKDDTYEQKYIYSPNILTYNDWSSSVTTGSLPSSNNINVQIKQTSDADFSVNIGNDYWNRIVSEKAASPGGLVE